MVLLLLLHFTKFSLAAKVIIVLLDQVIFNHFLILLLCRLLNFILLFLTIQALLLVRSLLLSHLDILFVLVNLVFLLIHRIHSRVIFALSVRLLLHLVSSQFTLYLLGMFIEHVFVSQIILLLFAHLLIRLFNHFGILYLLLSFFRLLVILALLFLLLLLFKLFCEVEQQVLARGIYLLRVHILLLLLLVSAWINLIILLLFQVSLVVFLFSLFDLVVFEDSLVNIIFDISI